MRLFIRYLFLLLMIAIAAWVEIPQHYHLEFPREPGPTFDSQMRELYIERLNIEQPDIVLLGDSTLKDGVDPVRLSELTGMKVSNFDVPGSASAFWYLVLKNNIIAADYHPKVVGIIFRDTVLTAPGYRVHGSYFTQLDEFAYRKEPLLLERAYINQMNPVEYLAEKYLPLYGARVQIHREIDALIRYGPLGRFGCDKQCVDNSMYEIFAAADLEPGQLQAAIASADEYLYAAPQLDFTKRVDGSFLPEMIRLTRENDIVLILIRLKSQRIVSDNSETLALSRYIADLTDNLARQNVLFLDYGEDPRLTRQYYKDNLHLTVEGETVFTQILAEGLLKVLK